MIKIVCVRETERVPLHWTVFGRVKHGKRERERESVREIERERERESESERVRERESVKGK